MFLIHSRGTSKRSVTVFLLICIQDEDVGDTYICLRTLTRKPVCGHCCLLNVKRR